MEYAKKCLSFIDESVSCYHAVLALEERFLEAGFQELKENEDWKVEEGGAYFVKRNESSILAFRIPQGTPIGFGIVGAHSDFPTFKLKTNPDMTLECYAKLNTEPYGGMIYSSWLDRPLSIAGRVVYRKGNRLESKVVNIDEDLMVIPNVAIHMERDINKGFTYNPQTDLLPLWGTATDVKLEEKIAAVSGLNAEDILGKDLFLYVREKGKLAGADKELMVSPRLDDLTCVFAAGESMTKATPQNYIPVCAVFDNEEVGSSTRQGAVSTFLHDTLKRIVLLLDGKEATYFKWLAESFMISADNAHALHPNHPEKADVTNKPVLNGGIVIKYHGGQKYTTDAYSEAVMKLLCKEAEVSYQTYQNRSDVSGGSTLGNVSARLVPVACVDIGLPQLAMHSAVETAGSHDVDGLVKVLKVFFDR